MPQISLKKLTPEIYEYLLIVQGEKKLERKTSQYSLEKTVMKIICEHKEFTAKIKSKKGEGL